MAGEFDAVYRVIDRWDEAGRVARLWLRDDDAVGGTPALLAFRAQCEAAGLAPLLAVIPDALEPTLAPALANWPEVAVAVHGWRHENRAAEGAKKCEFPEGDEAHAAAVIGAGRRRLVAAFADQLLDVFVPPWNRIARDVAVRLPGLGFSALSTYASANEDLNGPDLVVRNTHVDVIDWKGGRTGKDVAQIARELATALEDGLRRGRNEIGVLTHHLVHDRAAVTAIDCLVAAVQHDGRMEWISPRVLFARDVLRAGGAE